MHVFLVVYGIFNFLKRKRRLTEMVSRLFVFDLFFRVRLFFISLVQQVINAGMIEVCQLDEDTGGNISFSQFIMRICNLRTVQIIRKVFLIQIMVFPQISDSLVSHHPPPFFCYYTTKSERKLTNKTICFIIREKERMLVESYEKPYFRLFCTVCDVIENVELFLENTALTGTQQQFLRKQIEQLKRVQQITEEMVIVKDEERKIYRIK
jgi:hypothetical protein